MLDRMESFLVFLIHLFYTGKSHCWVLLAGTVFLSVFRISLSISAEWVGSQELLQSVIVLKRPYVSINVFNYF